MSIADQVGLRTLKIFQALMRELNVSRAADKVGLTQQAVSTQLKKLREVFRDPLFVRTGNGLTPTPAAERLYAKIDKIILELDGLAVEEPFDPATVDGTFVIAATDYAQIIVMPALLERLCTQAPNLKLVIQDIERDRLLELMQSGQIDLLISFPEVVPDALPRTTLFQESYLCVTSKDNPLTQEEADLGRIAAQPQIAASPSRPNHRESIDEWFEEKGFARNVIVSAPCFSLVPEYIQRTKAVAFLPSRSFDPEKLALLDIGNLPDGFDVVVAWHNRSNSEPLNNWMRALLIKTCQSNQSVRPLT